MVKVVLYINFIDKGFNFLSLNYLYNKKEVNGFWVKTRACKKLIIYHDSNARLFLGHYRAQKPNKDINRLANAFPQIVDMSNFFKKFAFTKIRDF